MDSKAKCIGKYHTGGHGYGDEFVNWDWEYRGHTYTTCANLSRGYSESLREQHRKEQGRIDSLIEDKEKPERPYKYEDSAEAGIDAFLRFCETGEWED